MKAGFSGVVEFARSIGQSWSAAVLIGANLVPLFGVIFGGFFAMALGSPVGVLVVLVLLKIGVDLGLHLKEREHAGAIPLAALARGKRRRK